MRTTLDIDDAVLAVARALARDTGTSVGAAVSALARRGLAPVKASHKTGFPVFDSGSDAPPITLEMVNALRDVP
jgi:hypothetical protein